MLYYLRTAPLHSSPGLTRLRVTQGRLPFSVTETREHEGQVPAHDDGELLLGTGLQGSEVGSPVLPACPLPS